MYFSALPPDGEGARGTAVLEGQRRGAGRGHGHVSEYDGDGRSNVFDVSSEKTRCGVHLKNCLYCLHLSPNALNVILVIVSSLYYIDTYLAHVLM